MNLYLYISPHSSHPPGVTKGLIFGAVNRAKNLCSDPNDIMPFIRKTLEHLVQRGHHRDDLLPIFNEAIKHILLNPRPPQPADPKLRKNMDSIFLHLPYNPSDPTSKQIQEIFCEEIMKPDSDPIEEVANTGLKKLTICYHGQKKLRRGLAPSRLHLGTGFKVSDFLKSLAHE